MKLMILYGPPGVGKLTVARALAKKTDFKLFHNHMTVDFLTPIIPYGTKGFFSLLNRIRLLIFETAAKQNRSGIIFTFVYAKGADDVFIQEACKVVESNGGEVHLVRLYCDEQELFQRVTNTSRKEFRKITTAEQLKKNLAEDDLTSAIPLKESLEIDTTDISPQDTANKIMSKLNLEAV